MSLLESFIHKMEEIPMQHGSKDPILIDFVMGDSAVNELQPNGKSSDFELTKVDVS